MYMEYIYSYMINYTMLTTAKFFLRYSPYSDGAIPSVHRWSNQPFLPYINDIKSQSLAFLDIHGFHVQSIDV